MAVETDLTLLKRRRTRIVATIGPASREPAVLRQLLQAGVDVVRLNFSHGSHDDHRATYQAVREAAKEAGRPVAVLADLCGPKIRVGLFPGGPITLVEGGEVTVTTRQVPGTSELICSQYEALAGDVVTGDRILLDDGALELKVLAVAGTEIRARVVVGGVLKDKKGMNLPGVKVSAPALTEKDRTDAAFALSLGVDWIALSFVQKAADVHELRALIDAAGGRASIIAKIEKPEALADIDGIMHAADGIMVARGDLGVELPLQQVPLAQDQLISLAREHRKPVIVATQMLESMISAPRPTRAEVSDVAGAVRAGADAVMLSAETAAGRYPVQAVQTMDLVCRQREAWEWKQGAFKAFAIADLPDGTCSIEDAVAAATAQLSRDLLVRAIVVGPGQERAVAVMSALHPASPIIALATDPAASQRDALRWGVVPVTVAAGKGSDLRLWASLVAAEYGLAGTGQRVLLVSGFSADPARHAPSVTVVTV